MASTCCRHPGICRFWHTLVGHLGAPGSHRWSSSTSILVTSPLRSGLPASKLLASSWPRRGSRSVNNFFNISGFTRQSCLLCSACSALWSCRRPAGRYLLGRDSLAAHVLLPTHDRSAFGWLQPRCWWGCFHQAWFVLLCVSEMKGSK